MIKQLKTRKDKKFHNKTNSAVIDFRIESNIAIFIKYRIISISQYLPKCLIDILKKKKFYLNLIPNKIVCLTL